MKKLWEILVPTTLDGKRIDQEWDDKVSKIAGGLTILKSAKGRWLNYNNELMKERMIQVRIIATERQMSEIADMTAEHYRQETVAYYLISSFAVVKTYN